MAPSRFGPTYERANAADLCKAVSTTIILKTKKRKEKKSHFHLTTLSYASTM